jgi:SAM-dependent methyltransferase
MLKRSANLLRQLAAADDKLDWVRGQLAWRRFGKRLEAETERNIAFDRRYGTDTAEEVALTDVGLSPDQAAHGNSVYRVFWEDNFKAIFDDLPIDHSRFAFVDVGSGKGKLLLLASLYPFRQIAGVELANGLHDIARHNISVFADPRQRCREITSIHADALAYALPAGPVVCLMVNPFDDALLKRVINHLGSQGETRSDPVYVIYANMRRITEKGTALDDPRGLEVLVRRTNHIIWGNRAASAEFVAARPKGR